MNWKVRVYETEVNGFKEFIKTPDHVLQFIKDDFDYNERLIVLGMNIKNKVLTKKCVAIGSHNNIMITAADIIIPLLVSGCRAFVMAHNHPSEDCAPSREDIIFTKKVKKACEVVGVNLIDHLIVSDDDYYSFKKNGLI